MPPFPIIGPKELLAITVSIGIVSPMASAPSNQTGDLARPRSPVSALDPAFKPAILFQRDYLATAKKSGQFEPLIIGLERENGQLSRHETIVKRGADPETLRFVEQLVKFLLWARGGGRVHIGGPGVLADHLRKWFSPDGPRAFDAELMSRVYEKPFAVVSTDAQSVPAKRESHATVGGHLDGCRIGFDLGASDYKVAAVRDGDVVFSEEFPWNPKVESDPEYHFRHLDAGLKAAAAHLPQVDAIGGSSAGVIVNNRAMVASLFRAVPREKYDVARDLFLRIGKKWKVPIEVANDGDVTALAGAMSLRVNAVLGIAMGSSQAAGFLDRQGAITGWLNELAFAPIDCNPDAAVDEWSGDRGVGALYFSQQAIGRLLTTAGIALPEEMPLPEKLKHAQELMDKGDNRAQAVYETIGVYLGYTIPLYAQFYDFEHLLVLGRVTTGAGGDAVLGVAANVLRSDFPEIAVKLHLPDEKSRRVGQAVAAASLPAIPK